MLPICVPSLPVWSSTSLLLGLFAFVARPEPPAGDSQKKNDPASCPYCKGEPEVLAKAGLVNHGPFEFGINDTVATDALLATSDIRWVESAHFQIGIALGNYKIKEEEKRAIRAELDRLALVLPNVDTKPKVLDPWIRVHLYAQRCEDVYKRFCELMKVKDSDFPSGTGSWDGRGKYMGEGPYLGEKGKYEVLLVPSQAAATQYMTEQYGLQTKKTQRWNIVARDTITLVAHTNDGSLKEDPAMHGHVGFNLAINLLDGYKHYSYETPIWIREGLGHFIEREINPKFNTFDSSEGSVAEMTRKQNWEAEVKKMIAANQHISMADLMSLKDYSGLTLPYHYTTWSMTDFLVKTRPDGYACINDKLHGRMNKLNFADGSNLPDAHREAFQECLGMTYPQFESAWLKWVETTYTAAPP